MALIEYITDQGKEMLAQMLAGKVIISFTKVQMGDGTLSSGQSRKTMTALINVIEELSVYKTSISTDNVVSITAIFDNSSLTSGFYFREKGVFASDGTEEILFAYANAGSSAEYINSPTVELVEKQIVSLYTGQQDTETELHITIASGIYALTEDLEEHTSNKSNPHNVNKNQIGLGNVDNTSDSDKPLSTVQQEALDLKVNKSDVIESTAITEDGKVMGGKTSAEEFAKINQSLTKRITSHTFTIEANGYKNHTFTSSELTGYAFAVIGIQSTGADLVPTEFFAKSDGTIYIVLRNITTMSVTRTINVVYLSS